MTDKKLRKLFDLCAELYAEEQEKSGMLTPMPYAYAKCGGEQIIYSAWRVDSEKIEAAVKNLKHD